MSAVSQGSPARGGLRRRLRSFKHRRTQTEKQSSITPCEVTVPSKLHGMEAVQNIARGMQFHLVSPQNYPTAILSGRILSYFVLPYPTLSYFFAHIMISLGGSLLDCLLHAKALLRGELSAQQTEGFQTPPHADRKTKRYDPVRSHRFV